MATNTNALDIVILSGGNETDANLANDFADENGDELFKYLAANGVTTSGITVDNNADKLLIIAYDGGEAFLYSADAGAGNSTVAATELKPLIHFDSQVGTFVAADFVMA